MSLPFDRHAPAPRLEFACVALAALAVGGLLATMWYGPELQEPDLYVEALGLVHGKISGLGPASPLHYAPWLSYGYPRLVYAVGSGLDLTKRDAVVGLMNAIGHVSSFAIFPLLWTVLRLAYGRTAAWAGALLVVLSPVFLEVGASGHQILTAAALFLAAFACLIARPAKLPMRAGLGLLGFLILCAALTVRFEVAFALPWVVLAGRWEGDARRLALGMAGRAAVCVAALGVFFVLRKLLLGDTAAGAEGSFFSAFYKPDKFTRGIASSALALGLASCGAAALALGALGRRLWRGQGFERPELAVDLFALVALAGLTLVFWIANPLPARHFLFFVIAAAAVTGIASARVLAWRPATAALAAVGLALANQAAAAIVRPAVMRLSPEHVRQPLAVLPSVPVGTAWTRRRLNGERKAAESALGDRIASVSALCERRLVVLSDQAPTLALALFRGAPPATLANDGYQDGAVRLKARWPGRAIDYIYRSRDQQSDLPAQVLADPAYAGARLVIDPYARLVSDRTEPPPARDATLDCAAAR